MSWKHTTPRLRTPEPRRWRLRTYLVAPVVLVALAVALSHANIELSIRAQTENLVAQRGQTVLGGIEQQLTERERAMQVYAQLLADQSGVVLNTDAADKIGLAQVLLPQKAKLDLERIAIQLPGGQDLILRITAPQRVLCLECGNRVDGVGAPERLRCGLGQPEVAHLALPH